ncbi:replication-relaxation family protein [Catellatospora sp. NPDC049111]|uniref:replication-relaxation family protein n=1 Tax=Catellatospora sp. NPDC049111 TaxID=3155271 RepID=UPI0033F88AAF
MDLTAVTPMLTDRDIAIVELLGEHGVLTSPQITAAFFGSPHTALHRLRLLRIWGVLDRFVRYRPGFGSYPYHWVAGPVGARWLALSRDEPAPSLRAVRERRDRLASSPKLDHLIGVNQFFTDLLANSRTEPGCHLLRWWSERTTANRFGRRINPDGHGLWTVGDRVVGFYVEHDTGTEQLDRLVAKLDRYRRLRAEGGPGFPVLFWLPSKIREQNLHRRLNGKDHGVVVASAFRDAGLAAWQPVWKVQGNGRHRLALHELPSDPGVPGPLNPS